MKHKKWLLIGGAIIIIIFAFEKINTEYTNKFISPNKTNLIQVKAKNPAGFLLFGSSDIEVQCRKNNVIGFINKVTIKTSIANDGSQINDSNFNVEWISDDTVTITLSGYEQSDEVIKVDFDDIISYK